MKFKEFFKENIFILIILLIIIVPIIIIILFPNHKAHNTILEYLKIIFSLPGVILISSFILLYIIRLIFFPKTKTEFVEVGKEDVTGFIKIVGKTKEDDLIIKNDKKYKIEDGCVIVNEEFILKFWENK